MGGTLDQLRKPLPPAWTEQRRRLGFPATAGRNDDDVSHEPERRRRAGRGTGRASTATEPMPMNPEIRYWRAIVRNAEAELDAATTHADLKLPVV